MAGFGFLGALGGLGQGLSAVGENMRRNDDADASEARQQRLEAWRAQTAEAYKISAEQRAQAPLNRLSAAAQAKASEEVPVESAPVRTLGADSSLKTGGMSGDYDALVARASSLPEADRAPYLAQLEQQRGRAQTAADESVAGKTRKRSNDEAFDSAMSDARLKDPQAYVAGKAMAQDKTVTVPDGASVISRDGKVIFDGSGTKSARMSEQEDRRDARAREAQETSLQRTQMMIDGAEKRRGGDGKLTESDRRAFTDLMQAARRSSLSLRNSLGALRKDTLFSMQANKPGTPQALELADLTEQIKRADRQGDEYAQMLLGSAGGGSGVTPPIQEAETPKAPPAPAPASDNRAPKAARPPLSSFLR